MSEITKKARKRGLFCVRAFFFVFLAVLFSLPLFAASTTPNHFDVAIPATSTADAVFYITVTAKTLGGATVTDYDGIAVFYSSTVVSNLPADYVFLPADMGVHVFQVQLMTSGDQTVTVYDNDLPWVTGSGYISITGGSAQLFTISAPSIAIAGQPFYITVTAKDSYNNVAVYYSGSASFSSTDGIAMLPPDTTFQTDDNGKKILSVTMKTKGTQLIKVQDLVTPSMNGSGNAIEVRSGIISRFIVDAPTSANPGTGINYNITAMDAYGNIADTYTGAAHFTSTDGAAVLPFNYVFLASDYGSRYFSATLNTAGNRTISVNDASSATINGISGTINVNSGFDKYSQPLLMTSYLPVASMYQFEYVKISETPATAVPANAYLEYDVFLPEDSADFYTGTEIAGSWAGGSMRDFGSGTQSYIIDQNGVRCHPSMDLSSYARGKWYHRKFDISAIAGNYTQLELAQDTGNAGANGAPSNKAGTFNALYDNIQFTNSAGAVLKDFYSNRNTIPYLNGVVVNGDAWPNTGNGGTSTPAPLNNFIYIVKDLTLSINPAAVIADGVHPVTVTAFLSGPVGAAIGYALTDFNSDRAGDVVAPVAVSQNTKAITDPAGNARARVYSTKAGQANITVKSAHLIKIIAVNFIAGPAFKASILPQDLSIQRTVGASKAPGTLQVGISDTFGNFAATVSTINLSSSSPTMQFSSDNGNTWQAGLALSGLVQNSVLVIDTDANTASVLASVGGLASDTCTVYVNDSVGASLSVNPVTVSFKAGAVSMLTVRAKDSAGNYTFSNGSVSMSSASATMRFSLDSVYFSQALSAAMSSGRLDVYYYDTVVAANVTITAQSTGYANGKSYRTTTPADPALLAGWSNKYSVKMGDSVTITAQITDIYGNAVANRFITFTAQVEGGIENALITPPGNSTNALGQVTVVYWTKSGSAAKNYAIINAAGLLGKTLTIAGADAAGATKCSFLPNPLGLGADKTGTLFLTAKDAGGYNSPAPAGHNSIFVYVTYPAGTSNVSFSINGGTNWYNYVTATLDTSGTAQLLVKSHFPGTYNFKGADINPASAMMPAFSTFTVSSAYYVFVSPSVSLTATAGAFVTITAQIVDQNGTAVSMAGVHAFFSTNKGSVSPSVVYTDAFGKAVSWLGTSISPYTQHFVSVVTTGPDGNTISAGITSIPVITFDVTLQTTATRGIPVQVVVRARDAYGVTIPNYTGTVHFTSTDTFASLPADYTFIPADGGIKAFTVTFGTASASPFTVTSTDTLTSSITGTSNNILIYNAATPSPTCSPTKTMTLTKTITSTRTVTPTVTQTHTYSPTFTLTQTGTHTTTQTATQTITRTNTVTHTFTRTPTFTMTPTISQTWTISKTHTISPTFTMTQTMTESCTSSPTFTKTQTFTATQTITGTDTATSTFTHTMTATKTCTFTPTHTATNTRTSTPTPTITYTCTVTITRTTTLTPTVTMTHDYISAPLWQSYVFPQPAVNVLNIMYAVDAAGPVTIDIYNAAGMPVADLTYTAVSGYTNNAVVDLNKFAGGVYYYVIRTKNAAGSAVNFKVNKFIVTR